MREAEQPICCATTFVFARTCTDHFWKEAQEKSGTGLPPRRAAERLGPGKTALCILFCTSECLCHANRVDLYSEINMKH